jgi:WD40 repeat protein
MKTRLSSTLLLTAALALPALSAGAAAPGSQPPAVDLYGNPLPAGAVARLGTVSFFHKYGDKVAYSGDGKLLASSGNGVIHLWDPATGRDLGQFPGDRGFTLSADGTRLAAQAATGPQGLVVIWDTRSRKELHRLRAHDGEAFALAFSPDGKLLATAGLDGTLRLWNALTGKQVCLVTEIRGYIGTLAFSHDGRTLFSGEALEMAKGREAQTRLWEVATGKERQRIPQQVFVTLSPDGEVMALSGEQGRVLRLVKWRTGEALNTLKGFRGRPGQPGDWNTARFAPDGKIIATTSQVDEAIHLWHVASGIGARDIPLGDYTYSIAFAPDGKTLAAGVAGGPDGNNRIRLFDPATGDERVVTPGRLDAVHEVRFLPGGKAVAGTSADRTFRLWQPDGKALRTVELAKLPRALSPDGALVAVSGKVELLRPGSIPPVREDTLQLYDTTTGQVRHQLKHDGKVVRAAWAPDGGTVAVATDQERVYLWDAATGKLRRQWGAAGTWSLVFSPDGKMLATGDGDCTVQLWQAASGKLVRRFGTPLDREKLRSLIIAGTTSIAFSADGKSVAAAVASQNTITVWDVASGEERWQRQAHPLGHNQGWIYALTFTPDGKTLFSGSQDRTIRLWDAATGKERGLLQGHRAAVHALAVSPDGTRLASGSKDCTVLVWDVAALTR